jgi:glycosyltransferase involved in cell wall biosynthesis
MSEPTFSIVITAYEVADVIGPAVESALNQTRPAEEVLVVDDGSKDDLEAALAPFEGVKLVRKDNGGGASARNAGVAAASGDFMAILDADDAFHPRRIEAVSGLVRQRPELDLIATDARFVVGGKPTGTFFEDNEFPHGDQRTAIFATCFPTGWPTVRISALQAAGGFDERMRIAYDWECWLRMILAGSEVGLVPEPLYDYVLHGGSLASSRVASLGERVVLLEKASANPNLRQQERPVLEGEIARRREEYSRAAIGAATAAGERRELIRLARSRGLRARTRIRAALSALAPGVGRRLTGAEPPPERHLAEDRPASA